LYQRKCQSDSTEGEDCCHVGFVIVIIWLGILCLQKTASTAATGRGRGRPKKTTKVFTVDRSVHYFAPRKESIFLWDSYVGN